MTFKFNPEEPSTKRGIAAVITGVSTIAGYFLGVDPQVLNTVLAGGVTVIGSLGMFLPDKKD